MWRPLKSSPCNLSPTQAEKKKAGQGDDSHCNPEIDKLKKEVQETKEINKKLKELLQVRTHADRLKNPMCSPSWVFSVMNNLAALIKMFP